MSLASAISLPDEFNAAEYFVDRHMREGRSRNIAIECGETRVTYGQVFAAVNQVGNALRQIGIRAEERVLLLLLDCPEFAASFFGAIKIGAVPVPVNTLLKPADYKYLLNNSRARVAIVSQALLPLIQEIPRKELRFLERIVVVGEPGGEIGFTEWITGSPCELDPAPTGKDDAAFWLYSSGSTGPPKACVHLQHDMVVSTERYAKAVLRIQEGDRFFSVAKLFFAYGLGNALYFPLSVGATSILLPGPPRPQSIFEVIERHRPTLLFSVPSNYVKLLAHPAAPTVREFDLSSVRHAISAGEALPASVFHRFKERFGVEILDAIGSTEALHMMISNVPGKARPGSSGTVLPGFEAKIVDDNDQPVTPGDIGNLLVKADSVCAYYWNDHEKTKNTIIGHWLRTGDKYHQDQDGYFWYAGRCDDMLKVSGVWLSPIEIERVLSEHPAVLEVAVVFLQDQDELFKPAACIVLREGTRGSTRLARELQEFVVSRLPIYKRPHWVQFVPELPKTATGKVQRYKLRAQTQSAISRPERSIPGTGSL